MTEAPAFFRAIEANPADDTPRLVFADWLDENATNDTDHARAELIRVQCERFHEEDTERRRTLEARENQLVTEHGSAWATVWPTPITYLTYRRGFLDPVHIGPAFVRCAERLSEVMPLFHLRLYKARVVMKSLAACPQLEFVRHLTMVSNVLRNADMTALAASPHLGNLQCLDVSENKIGIRGATDLASATCPSLRILRLANNPIKDRGLLAIVQTSWPSLECLDVMRCELKRVGVIGLAESSLVSRLTTLQLSGNSLVTTDAWIALARAPMERLQRLDLSNAAVTNEVAAALAVNESLANLRVLHLGAAMVTASGARAILNSPHLRNLTRLRIPETHLDTNLRDQLRARFGSGFNPRA